MGDSRFFQWPERKKCWLLRFRYDIQTLLVRNFSVKPLWIAEDARAGLTHFSNAWGIRGFFKGKFWQGYSFVIKIFLTFGEKTRNPIAFVPWVQCNPAEIPSRIWREHGRTQIKDDTAQGKKVRPIWSSGRQKETVRWLMAVAPWTLRNSTAEATEGRHTRKFDERPGAENVTLQSTGPGTGVQLTRTPPAVSLDEQRVQGWGTWLAREYNTRHNRCAKGRQSPPHRTMELANRATTHRAPRRLKTGWGGGKGRKVQNKYIGLPGGNLYAKLKRPRIVNSQRLSEPREYEKVQRVEKLASRKECFGEINTLCQGATSRWVKNEGNVRAGWSVAHKENQRTAPRPSGLAGKVSGDFFARASQLRTWQHINSSAYGSGPTPRVAIGEMRVHTRITMERGTLARKCQNVRQSRVLHRSFIKSNEKVPLIPVVIKVWREPWTEIVKKPKTSSQGFFIFQNFQFCACFELWLKVSLKGFMEPSMETVTVRCKDGTISHSGTFCQCLTLNVYPRVAFFHRLKISIKVFVEQWTDASLISTEKVTFQCKKIQRVSSPLTSVLSID